MTQNTESPETPGDSSPWPAIEFGTKYYPVEPMGEDLGAPCELGVGS
jgi:hypothetical protein